MKRNVLIFPLLFLIITTVAAQHPQAEKIILSNSKLENFFRIDEGIYRSEQPTKKDFNALEAFGIKEVLNLRRFHSDKKKAEDTALTLHRIKTHAHSISAKQVTEALRVIKNRKGPIVIHCKHGSDRTGAVIAMYRIVFQGFTKEKAIQEMKEGGFGFHKIYSNIVRMIRKADVDHIKKELDM